MKYFNVNKIIIFFILIMILIRCEKKCPLFNTDILNWLPYKANDTIVFYKGDSSSKIIVSGFYINHADHYGSCKQTDCACDESINVKMQFDSIDISLGSETSQNFNNSFINITCDNGEFSLRADSILSNYELNGNHYDNVIVYDANKSVQNNENKT